MYGVGSHGGGASSSGVSKESVYQKNSAELWGKNSEELFRYENLHVLAVQNDVVQLEQNDAFFVLRRPVRTENLLAENQNTLGWKLHISVDPSQLDKAFNLAAPVIGKYCFCFKVINPEKIRGERYKQGAQITVYLEEQEKPVLSANDAEKMIGEINQLFLKNKIIPGIKPDSDAETISQYVSIRNDKSKFMLNSSAIAYCSWQGFGKNFNPANNPNPFDQLLTSNTTPFDVLAHFQSCQTEVKSNELSQMHFYLTLFAYLREHTVWDDMSNQLREKFMFQYCVKSGNNLDKEFLKKAYQNNLEILMAVKQAFYMVFVYEVNTIALNNKNYHQYVNAAQFSAQYPCDNSFKKLITTLEAQAKEQVEIETSTRKNSIYSLIDFWKLFAEKRVAKFSFEELITSVEKQDFYHAQAALKHLQFQCSQHDYLKILHSNQTIPAVQIELARIYKSKSMERSEKFLLTAMLSRSVDCIEIDPNKIAVLLKHHSLQQLQSLSEADNPLATFVLAMIYAQDVLNKKTSTGFEKFSHLPANHNLTKKYLDKLNGVYAKEVGMLNDLISQ